MNLQELLSPARRAIDEFNMITDGDNIVVGLSGGKDSVTLLTIMAGLKRFYPKKFNLSAITIDMGFKETSQDELTALKNYSEKLNVPLIIEKTDIAEVIFDIRNEKNPCSLCAKMRRGALCSKAVEMGANKLCLGHHADDLIETFFLSMFYEGRLSTFQPISLMSKTNITLIRPMIYIKECDIVSFSKDLPILHNPCPKDKNSKREFIKDLIKDIKKDIPFVKDRIHSAITSPERYNLFDKLDK